MELHHLETFVKADELKSFTEADKTTHLAHPMVSKQIIDLERCFQVRLIDRTKRSVALTKTEAILLKYESEFLYSRKETSMAIAPCRGRGSGRAPCI
ncbi:MAG: LysR family transcriptional regulator [Syntrophobacterales bacterium]|jgi:DNA-binding transcriptional LysR family regulator|nr:LysR family transcriptional regulator [Syntrophobacterales bacterium]